MFVAIKKKVKFFNNNNIYKAIKDAVREKFPSLLFL